MRVQPSTMSRLAANSRYLLLVPAFGLLVGAVLLSSGPLASNAQLILILSGLILVGTALVWTRREGLVSPVPIVALGLVVYFPVRALVLLSTGLTNQQGINQNVTEALASTGALAASVDVLIVAVVFAITCELIRRFAWVSKPRAQPARRSALPPARLSPWAIALLISGVLGVVLQIPAGIGFLQGDEASGGLVVQVIYLASFGFGLGVILSWQPRHTLPGGVWFLLALVAGLGFYMGSKDTLFQPLLAVLFAGAAVNAAKRSGSRLVVGALVVGVLIFLVFPAVTTYRREIILGKSPAQALVGVPGELASNTVVMGVRRTGGALGIDSTASIRSCWRRAPHQTHRF